MEKPEELNQQKQMEMAFMNEGGVLADDGVERDPVSGNEVPAGSMAEEVRDDVPAMLSEGEYVVPADVVRYHGIDKFEELRDEAKMGLSRMEADGRIGGQPVEEQEEFPFSVEELEGFNEGGTVGDIYPDVMGSPFTPGQRYPSSDRFPGVGFELRNFTNPTTGKTVVIPFFNGNPMQFIPPDFLEGGASTTRGGTFDPASDERDRQEREAEIARGTGRGMSDLAYDAATKAIQGVETGPQTKPFSEYSADDFRKYLAQRESGLGKVMDALPVVGLLTSMQDNAAREFAKKSLLEQKNIVTGQPLTFDESGILIQIAELPERQSVLSAIDNFLLGKKATPQQRFPAELGQQESGFADYVPPSAEALRKDPTADRIGQDPVQQYYGPPGKFQNIIEKQTGQTVSQEAEKIIKSAEQERLDNIDKANKDFGNRVKTIKDISGKALDKATDLFGITGLGSLDQAMFSMAEGQTTTNSDLLNRMVASGKYNEEDIATLNQFHMSEASVPFDSLKDSPTLKKDGKIDKDGRFTVYEDTEGYLTAGPGVKIPADDGSELPKVKDMSAADVAKYKSRTYDGDGLQSSLLKIYDEKKANVESRYGKDLAQFPPDVQAVVKRTLIDMNMQLIGGTSGFTMMNKALAEGNLGEMAKQITGNYVDADGKPAFSTDSGATKKSNTKYFDQMSGDNKDVLTDGNRAFRHATNLDVYKNWKEGVEQKPTYDRPQTLGVPFTPTKTQPLQQTFVPPQAPTADQIRLAGGIDAFAKQQAAPITPTEPKPLQDLPVGVSIEADGQFTGTGGLGAVQAPRVRTPIVKRDFLDPSMAMSRREELSDPKRFIGPTGAGLGPRMSEDESLSLGLARDFNRFAEREDKPSMTAPGTADDKLIQTQTDAMLADLQPKVSPTLSTKPATQARRLGLSPGAMGGRQLGMSPGAMGGRTAPPAPTPDFLEFEQDRTISAPPKREAPKKTPPKEEQISQQEYKKRVADATRRENEKARDRADSARDSVLRQGGSVQEAFDAAQTAFTGFTPSGEMVDPNISDPFSDIPNFGAFKEGGLASKPKKTKPKKRNTKKGLGGKMAT